jgi:hypothetical protein
MSAQLPFGGLEIKGEYWSSEATECDANECRAPRAEPWIIGCAWRVLSSLILVSVAIPVDPCVLPWLNFFTSSDYLFAVPSSMARGAVVGVFLKRLEARGLVFAVDNRTDLLANFMALAGFTEFVAAPRRTFLLVGSVNLPPICCDAAHYKLPPDGMCVGFQGCGEITDPYIVFSSGELSFLPARPCETECSCETELVCVSPGALYLVWVAQLLEIVDLIGSADEKVSGSTSKGTALGVFLYLLPALIGNRWRFRPLADRVCLILGRIYGF